jgi:hypothetical protein
MYSDAQRQMYLFSPGGQQSRVPIAKPTSPRLIPAGSPGPVTPLELEGTDGYLTAGVSASDAASHVEKLIQNEALRRGDLSPGKTASVGGI